MSYYCPECHVYWWPYMTLSGVCRGCGGGTERSQEDESHDVQARYAAALVAEVDRELYDRFEAYYNARGEQATEPNDVLELWGRLPTFDPEEAIRVALVVAERAERDKWIRRFNRLDAAINHHKRDTCQTGTEDDADLRLWKARDKIVHEAGET